MTPAAGFAPPTLVGLPWQQKSLPQTQARMAPKGQGALSSAARVAITPRAVTNREAPQNRPVTGKAGLICPGGQYWPSLQVTGYYLPEDLTSTHMADYWKRPETGAEPLDAFPIAKHTHGTGSGYCSSNMTVNQAEWMHREFTDTFRTTYKDHIEKGHNTQRVTSATL